MESPLPILDDITRAPKDGTLCDTHNYCKLAFNTKCTEHYKSSTEEGTHICPYGFATIVKKNNTGSTIYTSLNIDKISNKKWLKKKIKKHEKSILLDKKKVDDMIKSFELQNAEHTYSKNAVRNINIKENTVNDKKELLDDTLHELRRINKQLKKQAFFLDKELETSDFDYESVKNKAKNVLSSAQLVSVRLNAYDFTLNPGLVETGNKITTHVYRKFEKAKHCLSTYANDKKININFIGSCYDTINAYEIFDILPYVLIENAIRYSPEEGSIKCEFIVTNKKLNSIKITNIGPILSKEELPKLLEKGVRGKSVINKIKGTGKGLYIVKLICDYNDLEIKIDSVPIDLENGTFTATISFE
ncbi:MAG: hypothetical protein A3K10_17610 [Bacteroidetes bacterium RIFCSPLOWO2_12_FULL_31_6]|nr:MAG: hypothetical protein A3K10_17610 [Bacteroidetes bacterium RIFCSPLOWO2_12_FULL_31_6]